MFAEGLSNSLTNLVSGSPVAVLVFNLVWSDDSLSSFDNDLGGNLRSICTSAQVRFYFVDLDVQSCQLVLARNFITEP